MNYRTIALICLSVILAGCEVEPRKYKYIETERGLLSFGKGYCHLGMLTNNQGGNIYNEENKPITCTGYVYLTRQEAEDNSNE